MTRYRTIKKKFINEKECALCGKPATQIHHGKGRIGEMLFDEEWFIPVCDGQCHDFLETHPEVAKKLGLSMKRN